MADFGAAIATGISSQVGSRHTLAGRSPNVTGGLELPASTVTGIILTTTTGSAIYEQHVAEVADGLTYGAAVSEPVGQYWFEMMHTQPEFFELGNILAAITRDIEVYSSFREDDQDFNSATNNAGVGVSFVNLPSFPATIGPQQSVTFQIQILTTGPPQIDGTLDLSFDYDDLSLPITGTRVVMFPYEPESPIRETLAWKTSVLQSVSGLEQRVSLRKNPRQIIEMMVRIEEGSGRRELQTLLHGWQPGVFGVPIWFEARYLNTTADILDTTIYVDTRFADFRVDSLAIIWRSADFYDALEIDSMTDSSITFSSPVTKQFLADQALVMPLRVGITDESIQAQRYPVGLDDLNLRFTIQDNDSDLGDTSAFPTYNGKVLLSEPNRMAGTTLPVGIERRLVRIDNEIGPPVQTSDWPGPNFLTEKGFLCNDLERKWQVRQLLHALRGSQVSFYLPTFYYDMVLVEDLTNTSVLVDIENIGYTNYIDGQAPSDHIQIELVDGTTLRRQITASEEISESVERLTVDSAWTADVTVAEVDRITYLRTARIEDDQAALVHTNAQAADISMRVKEVFR